MRCMLRNFIKQRFSTNTTLPFGDRGCPSVSERRCVLLISCPCRMILYQNSTLKQHWKPCIRYTNPEVMAATHLFLPLYCPHTNSFQFHLVEYNTIRYYKRQSSIAQILIGGQQKTSSLQAVRCTGMQGLPLDPASTVMIVQMKSRGSL